MKKFSEYNDEDIRWLFYGVCVTIFFVGFMMFEIVCNGLFGFFYP